MNDMYLCVCCHEGTLDIEVLDPFLNNPLRKCNNCGHIQVKISPSQQVISDYYRDNYSDKRGLNLGSVYERVMLKRAAAQVEYIQRFISLDNASIMDIGCGFGHFLATVQRFTNNIKGYDYDLLAVDSCITKGLPVDLLQAESQIKYLSSADLCVLSHSLEHLVDPIGTLRSLGEKCRNIFIELPLYNPDIKEQFCDLEGHMHFFTIQSIQKLLQNNNFSVIDISTVGPSIDLFYTKRWHLICRLLQIFTNDLFINLYKHNSKAGIWARMLIKYKR